MKRLLKLILVVTLFVTFTGCFIPGHGWVVPGDELPGLPGSGDSGGSDRGGRSDHDSGKHKGHDKHH